MSSPIKSSICTYYWPYLMNWPININLTDIVAFRVKKVQKICIQIHKGNFRFRRLNVKKPVSKFFDLCPWITYKVYLEGFPLFSCPFPTSKVNYEKCPLPADWNRIGPYSMKRLPISISPWPCAVWWTNQVLSTETEKCNYLFFEHQTLATSPIFYGKPKGIRVHRYF